RRETEESAEPRTTSHAPTVYNNNIGIIQTKDNVASQSEMIHVVRIVRINGMHAMLPSMYGIQSAVGNARRSSAFRETAHAHRHRLARLPLHRAQLSNVTADNLRAERWRFVRRVN